VVGKSGVEVSGVRVEVGVAVVYGVVVDGGVEVVASAAHDPSTSALKPALQVQELSAELSAGEKELVGQFAHGVGNITPSWSCTSLYVPGGQLCMVVSLVTVVCWRVTAVCTSTRPLIEEPVTNSAEVAPRMMPSK